MTTVFPDTETSLELTNELLHEMQDAIPCEAPEGVCLSDHELPATWVMTHEDAQPACTVLACEPCGLGIKAWITTQALLTGPSGFECNTCHKTLHERQITVRKL
jgi:hypothetical protein